MARMFPRIVSCWIVSLYWVAAALPRSRSVHGAPGSLPPVWTRGNSRSPPAPPGKLRPQVGAQPRPVTVECHPDSMEVVVQADLFDTGARVDGAHLRLGSVREVGECGAELTGEAEFTIRARLTDCGIKLSSTEDKIIYSTLLVYWPEPTANGLLRLDGATIPVECHYEKKYSVDVVSLQPTWVPSVSVISADDQIEFELQLMSDDWQFERRSPVYFLGDLMHFEVSAVVANHKPLRVYADSCFATATRGADSAARYDFIENHGCFSDTYKMNSNSRFLPRVEDNKLRFQLEAFMFYQQLSPQIFITCHIRAVPVRQTISPESRACSLTDHGWQSVDGDDHACRSCHLGGGGHPITEALSGVPAPASRPTNVESSVPNRAGHPPATYVRFRPGLQQNRPGRPDEQSAPGVARRGTNRRTERTLQLGPVSVLPSRTSAVRSSGPTTASGGEKRKNN